jgi:hypothetical protein
MSKLINTSRAELITDVPAADRDGNFAMLALTAFEQTYRQIYAQSLEEASRIQKNNAILRKLEDTILDPATCEEMDLGQKIALAKILSESNQISTKALIEFGKMFKDIRSTVGFYENLQKTSGVKRLARAASKAALNGSDTDDTEEDRQT